MTFEEFQATRVWHEDLRIPLRDEMWGTDGWSPQGYVYADCLYIEGVNDHWPEATRKRGRWYLLLGRDDWVTDDLEALERRLYEYALDEEIVVDEARCQHRDDGRGRCVDCGAFLDTWDA